MGQHVAHRHSDEIAELRAEVERLRAALGHVIGACEDCHPQLAVEACLAVARGALNLEDEAGGIDGHR